MSPTKPERSFDPTTVPVSPAATVMLIRDTVADAAAHTTSVNTTPGIEVFMLRRTLAAVFGSGMYVFPGGRVEAGDGDDADRSHRLAAVRECFEEAGVLLARTADGAHVSDGHPAMAARHGVHDGTVDLVDLCTEHSLVLAFDELVWVSHWITPIGEARRFDTRFYLAPAPREQTSQHDDNETIASLWTRPGDALARQAAGELTMMPPTIKNLQFLTEFSTTEGAMAAARALPPPQRILPKLRLSEAGKLLGVSLPGEAGYEALA